jgi:2'-5' RNA ligase
MADEESSGYRAGETALIVTVPEAEPVVSAWRTRYDAAAAAGVPAHITVLYPFLDQRAVTAGVVKQLRALFAGHRAFTVELARARRFPGVLYLAPAPETELRALTDAVARRWPEAPPYRGQFEDVVPHLTVAHDQEAGLLDLVEADIAGQLPVSARVASVALVAFTGQAWREEHRFGLAGD